MLDAKVDSLQIIVSKTEIGKTYFDQIINLQLTVFVVIITIILGLVGLISWRFVLKPFEKSTENIRVEMNQLLTDQKTEFDLHKAELNERFKDLIDEQGVIARQAMRGIFYVHKDQDPDTAIIWGLRLAQAYLKDLEMSKSWILEVSAIFNKTDVPVDFDIFFDEIITIINNLKTECLDEEASSNLEKIEKECYKHRYSLTEKEKAPEVIQVDTNPET
jgi:hypothetical protein